MTCDVHTPISTHSDQKEGSPSREYIDAMHIRPMPIQTKLGARLQLRSTLQCNKGQDKVSQHHTTETDGLNGAPSPAASLGSRTVSMLCTTPLPTVASGSTTVASLTVIAPAAGKESSSQLRRISQA